jgi:hypothetical protein
MHDTGKTGVIDCFEFGDTHASEQNSYETRKGNYCVSIWMLYYNLGHSVTSVNKLHGELPNVDKLSGHTDMALGVYISHIP